MPQLETIVTVALTTIVTVPIALAIPAGSRAVRRWVQGRVDQRKADHATIERGSYARPNSWSEFMVLVRCAPDRRRSGSIDVDSAAEWVRKRFSSMVEKEPEHSDTELVRFQGAGGHDLSWLLIWSNGLLELACPVVDHDGELELAEIGSIVWALLSAIDAGAYGELFGKKSGRWRLDWAVAVTAYKSAPGGRRRWSALRFPGRAPEGRATGGYPANPTPSLGGDALHSRKQRHDPSRILSAVYADFLERSGYRGFDPAVDDLLAHCRERRPIM